jgi:hypothetical protein
MSHPHTEMTEVTKLVLYGWGYPDLFNSQAGTLLQNRLVKFPAQALPMIEAANQATFLLILPKLEMIRTAYLDRLNPQDTGMQPLWIWVDRPEQLSSSEVMNYRKKFADWEQTVAPAKNDQVLGDRSFATEGLAKFPVQFPVHLWQNILTHWQSANWRQRAIVLTVIVAVTLAVIKNNALLNDLLALF